MASVHFTHNIQRHVVSPPGRVDGATVREALEQVFAGNRRLRDYVLDDQGELRRHMTVFVDGDMVADRTGLSDPIGPEAEIYVMQALSGG